MSTDTVSGKFDQVVGKTKQSIGEGVGNEHLANEGAADQVKGNAKEAWGHVKDAASDSTNRSRESASVHHGDAADNARDAGHDLRDSITTGAEKIKNAVTGKTDRDRV